MAGIITGETIWSIPIIVLVSINKEAGERSVEREVKAVGVEQQALDHPLATAIAAFHQYYSHNCVMGNSRN